MLQKNRPGTLRERNMADRRRRILHSARAIIAAEGIEGLAMRKLADRAGVAVKTLYNLYGGREAILRALIDDSMDRMDAQLEEVAPLDDPLARCRAVVTVSIEHMLRLEDLSRAMVLARYQGLAGHLPDRRMVGVRAARMQAVAIKAGIDRGLFKNELNPDVLASQIYHGYDLAHIQWAFGMIDAEEFEARALYGVYVTLLAVAAAPLHDALVAEIHDLEAILKAKSDQEEVCRASSA
jgi:AcrR family transcriptional regulator